MLPGEVEGINQIGEVYPRINWQFCYWRTVYIMLNFSFFAFLLFFFLFVDSF